MVPCPNATTLVASQGATFLHGDPPEVFTPEDFDGDERLMIETAEAFCRNEVLPRVEALDKQEPGLMPRLVKEAGELGLCGVDTDETYGGLGLGKNLAARILEFMSLNGSFSVTYGITSGISQVGLSLFGTDEQKARFLPPLAQGAEIGAYALSEPDSGSDALSATSRATRDGEEFVLDGTKMWISNAQWADQFLTLAKVDGERFTAFVVPRDTPGVSIGREEHKMGLKGSSTARLVLDGARIPAEFMLHEEGKGHQVAFNALNIGRFKLASMSIGPARDAIALGEAYARDRKQFGRPIASFGLIQEKLALAAAKFFAIEAAIYRTGADMDAAFAAFGGTPEGNRKAAEEYAIECSAIKVVATEFESEIVDEMLQIYGGYGFTEEFPIARPLPRRAGEPDLRGDERDQPPLPRRPLPAPDQGRDHPDARGGERRHLHRRAGGGEDRPGGGGQARAGAPRGALRSPHDRLRRAVLAPPGRAHRRRGEGPQRPRPARPVASDATRALALQLGHGGDGDARGGAQAGRRERPRGFGAAPLPLRRGARWVRDGEAMGMRSFLGGTLVRRAEM